MIAAAIALIVVAGSATANVDEWNLEKAIYRKCGDSEACVDAELAHQQIRTKILHYMGTPKGEGVRLISARRNPTIIRDFALADTCQRLVVQIDLTAEEYRTLSPSAINTGYCYGPKNSKGESCEALSYSNNEIAYAGQTEAIGVRIIKIPFPATCGYPSGAL